MYNWGAFEGGALESRQELKLRGGIPFEVFFRAIDERLSEDPTSTLFLCSDSQKVIDGFSDRYGDAFVLYPSIRSDFGEMHANHCENKGIQFPRKKLGIDIVVKAHLLSRCDYFIHGNSNVANFVLCYNPGLEHQYIFA